MNHQEKIDRLILELSKKGVKPAAIATPVHRLFWKWGWQIPPSQCAGFLANALLWGTVFFVGSLPLWIGLAFSQFPNWVCAVGSVSCGLVCGLGMAVVYSIERTRYGLPTWNEYRASGQM